MPSRKVLGTDMTRGGIYLDVHLAEDNKFLSWKKTRVGRREVYITCNPKCWKSGSNRAMEWSKTHQAYNGGRGHCLW